MSATRCVWMLLAAAMVVPPAEAAAQEGIYVNAFQSTTGEEGFPLGTTARIRRGRGSDVTVVKHYIDLVGNDKVSVTGGGASLSNIRSHQRSGVGAKTALINIPIGTNPGTQVTLRIGGDQIPLVVVRNAIVESFTPNPAPNTIPSGSPWTMTISGRDLSTTSAFDPSVLGGAGCHNVQFTNRTNTSIVATLTRAAGCTRETGTVRLTPVASETPLNYRTGSGTLAQFNFAYASQVATCVSDPNVARPTITAPLDGSTITYTAATQSPVNVPIRWNAADEFNRPFPRGEVVITRTVQGGGAIVRPVPVSETVTGTSKTYSFPLPGTHTVSIRAHNCGQPAPARTITFSVRRQ